MYFTVRLEAQVDLFYSYTCILLSEMSKKR